MPANQETSFSHSIRMVRKSHLFNHDLRRANTVKNEKFKALADPEKPLANDLISCFANDLKFLGACLSECMQTNQASWLYSNIKVVESWVFQYDPPAKTLGCDVFVLFLSQ